MTLGLARVWVRVRVRVTGSVTSVLLGKIHWSFSELGRSREGQLW